MGCGETTTLAVLATTVPVSPSPLPLSPTLPASTVSPALPPSTISQTLPLATISQTLVPATATPIIPDTAKLGTPFEIKFGRPVQIPAEGLEVRFEQIITDSRCPVSEGNIGVACATAGQISIRVSIRKGEQILAVTALDLQKLTPKDATAKISPYTLKFVEVRPKRVYILVDGKGQNKVIPPEDYVATLLLNREQ